MLRPASVPCARSALVRLFAALMLLLATATDSPALDPARALRQYGQQLWQTDDGLPQNTVHAMQQTRDGYLWLATDGGLVRFDGIDFTLFDKHTAPQMPSNLIGALTETGDGALWIATSGGLLCLRQSALHPVGAAAGIPSGPVADVIAATGGRLWVILPEGVAFGGPDRFATVADLPPLRTGRNGAPIAARAADGSLWIATARQLVHLEDGRIATSIPFAADLLAVAGDGVLWAANADRLVRYRQGALSPVPLDAPHALASSIRALCPAGGGSVYVATDSGLARVAPDGTDWKTGADGLPPGRVLHLFADREGALWLSTEDTVSRYASGRFETLHARSGSSTLETFYEDREGDLWLGTDAAGLIELREQRFTTLTTADGLPSDAVRTLLADRDGSVWAGTDGSGLAQRRGEDWRTLSTRQGLASNTILSLAQRNDGTLAVGTPDGMNRVARDKASPLSAGDTLPDDFVRSLLTDPEDGSLWIGTRHGLAHQTAHGLALWDRSNGLGSDLVGALTFDRTRRSALWIGTRGGLSHLENGRLTTLTTRDGLSSDVITALYQDRDGALWIGTNGGGLSLLRDGRITAFPTSTAALPEVIQAILEDSRENLWLGSATGIYRVSRQQLDAFASRTTTHLDVAAFGVADGMRINECASGHPAAIRTSDGELWFATLRGISITNPEHIAENRLPPPVVIENVTVDDQPAALGAGLVLRPNSSRLSLRYAGLSFVAPARVRYRYRLVGFDPDWIEAGGRRVAYYTNIPPGRYRFQVIAANNDGVWNNTGASLEVQMLPHMWQTWWFRTLLVLTLLLAAYQAYRMRVRNVELRFDAVLAERTRIAREIHDTLAQDIVGISVQLELVSRLLGSSVDAARNQLDAARGLVKSSLAEARSSIWNLRSSPGGKEDLPARMHRAVTQAAAGSAARLHFAVHGTYRAAPAHVESELLRIQQEAVNNAVRHAAPTSIHVTLSYDSRGVELLVADNGCGFRYEPQAFTQGGHFGLQGMQERAAAIGGLLQVQSEPGNGARISLRVDIP